MVDIFTPILGIIWGGLIIIFRNRLSVYLERFYNKFPKYKNGIKTFNLEFKIKPYFFGALGSVIIIYSVLGLLALNFSF